MKPILILCLTMCCATFAARGADDEASTGADPAAAESAATAETAANVVSQLRQKLGAVEKMYGELKQPSPSVTSRYTRGKEEVEGRLKTLEEHQQTLKELESKVADTYAGVYVFEAFPVEDREKYEQDGEKLIQKALAGLSSKSESDQVEGIRRFEELRASYQGMTRYKETLELYTKVSGRLEKKWSSAKDSIEKARQKLSSSKVEKIRDSEAATMEKLENKMTNAGKDLNKEWFVPSMTNLAMLDKACQIARNSRQSGLNRLSDEADKKPAPELLRAYWSRVDDVVNMMRSGRLEEAATMLDDSDVYTEIVSLGRYSMPDEYRDNLKKQHQELRNELRKRSSEFSKVQREKAREESTIERESRTVENRLDNLVETMEREKENEERKAEQAAEEAARKAEEEAARKAEEEARKAEEAEAAAAAAAAATTTTVKQADEAPKASKKSKKKKS